MLPSSISNIQRYLSSNSIKQIEFFLIPVQQHQNICLWTSQEILIVPLCFSPPLTPCWRNQFKKFQNQYPLPKIWHSLSISYELARAHHEIPSGNILVFLVESAHPLSMAKIEQMNLQNQQLPICNLLELCHKSQINVSIPMLKFFILKSKFFILIFYVNFFIIMLKLKLKFFIDFLIVILKFFILKSKFFILIFCVTFFIIILKFFILELKFFILIFGVAFFIIVFKFFILNYLPEIVP